MDTCVYDFSVGQASGKSYTQKEAEDLKNYLYDFIDFFHLPQKHANNQIASLYVKKKLSTRQIAQTVGVSKTTVLKQLKESNVSTNLKINSKKYAPSTPPYGFKRTHDSQLAINKSELKICRIIVQLRKKGLSFNGIAQELNKGKLKTRKGTLSWQRYSIKNIFERWKDKI